MFVGDSSTCLVHVHMFGTCLSMINGSSYVWWYCLCIMWPVIYVGYNTWLARIPAFHIHTCGHHTLEHHADCLCVLCLYSREVGVRRFTVEWRHATSGGGQAQLAEAGHVQLWLENGTVQPRAAESSAEILPITILTGSSHSCQGCIAPVTYGWVQDIFFPPPPPLF